MMGVAISQFLPLAIGVAVSPISIIAVVLLLTTPRARVNGPAFVLGWLLGLGVVGVVVLALAGPGDATQRGQPATWASWLQLLSGGLLLVVAVHQFRGRPHHGAQAPLPTWMGAIDRFKPGQALGGGAVLAGANPMNLLLAVGGAAAIAQTGISGGRQAIAYALFAIVGTLGVGAPVGLYFAMGKRSAELLGGLKDWMGRHSAIILSGLCLVIGMKLLGDGSADSAHDRGWWSGELDAAFCLASGGRCPRCWSACSSPLCSRRAAA
jgi:Sap, sulfolipid-1-addressing protein